MSLLSTDLYSLITSDPTLSALIGTRLYANVAEPNSPADYIVFQRISRNVENAHSGYDDLGEARYQFTAYSKDQNTVESIRDALFSLLNCYDGVIDGQRVVILHTDDDDGFNPDTELHNIRIDFDVSRA
jgi:hypothetical protein